MRIHLAGKKRKVLGHLAHRCRLAGNRDRVAKINRDELGIVT